MALRTVGSTLLAKASPGGALRSKEENLMERPDIPESGAVGSVNRQMVEEPLARQVPEGSSKVVSATPTIEGSTVAVPGANSAMPMAPLGLTGEGPSGTPNRGANQPLFSGGVAPEAGQSGVLRSSVKQGATGIASSGGALPGAGIATGYLPVETPSQSNVQGERGEEGSFVINALGNLLGNKAYAGEGGNPLISTLGQALSGSIGKILTGVGNTFNAPQIVPGGLGAQMQTYGGAPSVTQSGSGSISKAVQNAAPVILRSLAGGAGQGVSKASNWLRSIFGW